MKKVHAIKKNKYSVKKNKYFMFFLKKIKNFQIYFSRYFTFNLKRNNLVLFLILFILSSPSFSITKSRASVFDPRIKIVRFQDNDVVPILASTFTSTQILFGHDEVIKNIENGDLDAWAVTVPKGLPNMLFIKPSVAVSSTNMTVVTNKHTYFFRLRGLENIKTSGRQLTYAVHFVYPLTERFALEKSLNQINSAKLIPLSETKRPSDYNWNYSFNGSHDIMPIHVFDDGQFTYLQLRPHQIVPAVFAVDNDQGKEAVVNYRKKGPYLVIQQLSPQFTLRASDHQVASLFNNKEIYKINIRKGER